jgi:arsenical pump membrane protein
LNLSSRLALMFSDALIWIVSLTSILCVLIRPRNVAEAWWAGGGAAMLVLSTLVPFSLAGAAILKGVDVYLFLVGMMILSELAREEGVFDWIAEVAATHAGGSPHRLFFLIYLAGTIVTAFLSNDATAVVLTPAVLTIVRRLKVEPTPHLLACALIANAASFVLPISNPANLVVFGHDMPPLIKWLGVFLAPSLASIVITFLALRYLSRDALQGRIGETLPRTRLSTEGRLALAGLIGAAAVLVTASTLGWSLGAPTCGAALLATLVVTCRDKTIPFKVVRGVSWSVIPLVAGLFVLVEAMQGVGMLGLAKSGLDAASRLGQTMGNLATAFSVGLLCNGMNNLPVGLISGTAVQSSHQYGSLANAVLVGVDLGPNLSVTGSLATILWLIALRREKVEITGWQFFKVGLIVMPLALLASILVLKN